MGGLNCRTITTSLIDTPDGQLEFPVIKSRNKVTPNNHSMTNSSCIDTYYYDNIIEYLRNNNIPEITTIDNTDNANDNTIYTDNSVHLISFTFNPHDNSTRTDNQQQQQQQHSYTDHKHLCFIKQLLFNNNNYLIEQHIPSFEALQLSTQHSFTFINKCKGYITSSSTSTTTTEHSIYLLYPYIQTSLNDLINENSLDFVNKLMLTKKIIVAYKELTEQQLTLKELSVNKIRFYGKNKQNIKLFGIEKISNENGNSNVYYIGNTLLYLFTNSTGDYNDICNVYIKAFIIGLLRTNEKEIPTINDIVNVFNSLVLHLNINNEINKLLTI